MNISATALSTLYVIVSGVFLGAWPMVMEKSGLSGAASGAVGAGVSAAILLPVAFLYDAQPTIEWRYAIISVLCGIAFLWFFYVGFKYDMPNVKWQYAIVSGLLCAAGLWLFFTGVKLGEPGSVAKLFTLMIVIQITVPIIYELYRAGGIPNLKTGIGLVAALIAAVTLS